MLVLMIVVCSEYVQMAMEASSSHHYFFLFESLDSVAELAYLVSACRIIVLFLFFLPSAVLLFFGLPFPRNLALARIH